MDNPIYNTIGKDYVRNRRADPRITQRLVDLLALPQGSRIADIGAGSGNYSNALADRGFYVIAVEPSEEMRRQAAPHARVQWTAGTAESLPLADDRVDGVVVVLAMHHFSHVRSAALEIRRVCPHGPIVFFTLDPRTSEPLWFADYFPEICQKDFIDFPPVETLTRNLSDWLGMGHSIHPFSLPHDLLDRSMLSAWNRPEDYLDETMRRNTSGFALADTQVVARGLSRLRRDLESGDWDQAHGHLRNREAFHAGFCFLKFAR